MNTTTKTAELIRERIEAMPIGDAFVVSGVHAVLIHGDLSDGERKARLAEYETGQAQVAHVQCRLTSPSRTNGVTDVQRLYGTLRADIRRASTSPSPRRYVPATVH